MITHIDFEDTLKMPNPLFIDVRSESEYEEDHIPHSINIPVFNDEERMLVGIEYKNKGPEEAKRIGLKIVSPKLPRIVNLIEEAGTGKQVILYCWRGGLRSHALATILDLMNLRVYRLTGGYKKYRHWINQFFQREPFPFEVVVIHGLTGTGKTSVINQLANLGATAIDLEGLANNRGSVFGNVGLSKQPSQKLFESLLWHRLSKIPETKHIIVECESKRIGKITIPLSLFYAMKKGKHVLLYDSVDGRIKRILSEYDVTRNQIDLINSLNRLKSRLGSDTVFSLNQMIIKGDYYPVVEKLLTNYYDPLYKYPDHSSSDYELSVKSSDVNQAAEKIFKYLSTLEMR